MIAAPVQCDVDGIPKGSHYVRVPIAIRQGSLTRIKLQPAIYFCLQKPFCRKTLQDVNRDSGNPCPRISVKN